MEFRIVLFILALYISDGTAQSSSEACNIVNDNVTIDWANALISIYNGGSVIQDIDVIDVTFVSPSPITLQFQNEEEPGAAYLDLEQVDETTISIKTNDNFANRYEDDLADIGDNKALNNITRRFTLKCEEANPSIPVEFALNVYVTDTNNHAPTFAKASYDYVMPMPLAPNIDLSAYGDQIIARDVDMTSTNNVTFSSSNPNFELETESMPNKYFRTIIKTTNYLMFDNDVALTITATDTVVPPLSSSTTINIHIDPDLSFVPFPTFENSIYRFNYTEDGGPSLVPTDGLQIKVTTDNPAATSVSLDDETYFQPSFNAATKEVTLDPTETPVGTISTPVMVLTLTVTTVDENGSGSAVVFISMPSEKVISNPKFSAAYYKATYKIDSQNQATVTLDAGEDIVVSPSDAVVEVVDDAKFTIDKGTGQWEITVETPLDDATLNKGGEYLVKLSATIQDGSDTLEGFGTLVIQLPEVPVFQELLYSGLYVVDPAGVTDTVRLEADIATIPSDDAIIVALDPNDNFEIVKTDKWGVNVRKNLDDAVLSEGKPIILRLTATLTPTSIVSSGTLVINLPPPAAQAPKFEFPLYTADYSIVEGAVDTVEVDKLIQVIVEAGQTANVVIDPNSDNFEIEDKGDGTFGVKVSADLAAPYNNPDIALTLKVEVTDAPVGYATLVIQFPKVSVPKFKSGIYTGLYEGDEVEGNVRPDNNIEVDADDVNLVSVTALAPYDANFAFTYDSASQSFLIGVPTPLSAPTLDETEIYVSLIVKDSRLQEQDTATLALKMPEKVGDIVPKFSSSYYSARYTVNPDEDDDIVEVQGPIEIASQQADNTEVQVINSFASNFEARRNGNSWELTVIKDLDSSILNGPNIVVTLEASLQDNSAKGTASVVVTWDPQSFVPAPAFTQSYFKAKYVDDELSDVDTISIRDRDDAELVELIFESGYEDYFSINQTKNEWSIELINPLDAGILEGKKELVVGLTAHLALSAADDLAALVIELPVKSVVFNNAFYKATYAVNDDADEVTVEGEIVVIGADDVSVADDDPYKDNFDVSLVSGETWSFTVKQNLDPDILSSQTEIFVVLEATNTNTNEKSETAIFVNLPLKDSTDGGLEFSQLLYVGVYDGSQEILTDFPISIKNEADLTTIELTPEGEYKDKFTFTLKDDHWEVTTSGLDSSIIDDEVSILLTLRASKPGVPQGLGGLVIQLPKKYSPTSFYFESSLYLANYEDNNLSVESAIKIINPENQPVNIALKGDDSYITYFNQDYQDQEVHIGLTGALPDAIVDDNAVITVTIEATSDTDETARALLAVKLPKIGVASPISFDEVSYVAVYTIKSSGDTIGLTNGPITISGTADLSNAVVTIEGDYKDNFALNFDTDHWNLGIESGLPREAVNQIALSLILKARADGGSAEAALSIQLPKKTVATTFYFDENNYKGEYSADHKFKLDDDIELKGDSDGVDLSLNGDYDEYFAVSDGSYSPVSITLAKNLSNEDLAEKSAITVDVVATRGEEETASTLVISLPKGKLKDKDSDLDQTGLIAAVAVLAVLLVGALVGSVVFYYLKFKTNKSYDSMYDIPANQRDSIEKVSRIDYASEERKAPINGDIAGETTTEEMSPAPLDKAKVVQFDTINIDELEIENGNEEQEDGEYVEVQHDDSDGDGDERGEVTDGTEERRTSRV